MAAHVDKRDKDEKGSGSSKPSGRTGTATGAAGDAPKPAWTADPSTEPMATIANGTDDDRAGEPADRVVPLADLEAGQTGGSRLTDTLVAPFGRYGQLTVTTVSVLVLGVLVYLAVNGLIVTTPTP